MEQGLWLALQQAKAIARAGDPLTEGTVTDLHRVIYAKCWPSQAGQYRMGEVDAFEPIADLPPHHSMVRQEMWAFGNELEARTSPEPGSPAESVRLGIWAHMELVRIHPFQEGNGKTARLLMDVVLMRHVLGPKRGLILPSHMRDRYLDVVQDYRAGNPMTFEVLVADLLELTLRREEALRYQARPGRQRRVLPLE